MCMPAILVLQTFVVLINVILSVHMLAVIVLCDVILSVDMPSVVASSEVKLINVYNKLRRGVLQ